MERRLGRVIVVLGALLVACGEPPSERDGGADAGAPPDAGPTGDAALDAPVPFDATLADAGLEDAGLEDAASDAASIDSGVDAGSSEADAGPADAGPLDGGRRVFDVRVRADSACSDLSFDPASISVPAGTSFTVNWINATGCTEIDIDMGGTVPIVLGLEPGTSYHDTVREWCGAYTGTYVFRAYYAPSFPYYLDVDCSG